MVRYRFGDFTLSPQRRLLVRAGREVPLIPKYFDLLLLLIERRHEAVHRREIFDRVWGDVSVSDSALSQAVRTIRSTLDDDSREPRFIRTVSRHGYQFVFPDVVEDEDDVAARPTPNLTPGTSEPVIDSANTASSNAARRCGAAAIGAGLAGAVSGAIGGLLLAAVSESGTPSGVAPMLAAIGGSCGALAGAGVGGGVAIAETLAHAARSSRVISLAIGGAIGGSVVGTVAQWTSRWTLASLAGTTVDVGGGLEGLILGAAAGLGFALATHTATDSTATPRGLSRFRAPLVTAALCAIGALVLTFMDRPLVGGTIHVVARAAQGSHLSLAPLGRLVGESDFGVVTRAVIAAGEGAMFGLGLAFGLIRR